VLVHPVLRRLAATAEVRERVTPEVVEELPASEPPRTPYEVLNPPVAPQPSPPPVEKGVEGGPLEVRLPEEFVEKFESLKREVSTLHKELNTLRDSLTTLAVELREAVTELGSPFNVLRGPTNGSEHKDGNGNRGSSRRLQPTTFLSVLKVLYNMLEEVGKEQALLLVRGYVDAGVVDREVGEALAKMVELADAMRRSGLSVEKQFPYTYAILKALNVGGRDLDDYVLRELLKRGKLG
jgi:hypothetical protein